MSTSTRAHARMVAVLAAMLLLVLSLGSGGAATATVAHTTGGSTTGTAGETDEPDGDDSDESDEDSEASEDEPQPVSRADRNSGGANGDCPDDGAYCSTRDGSPSQNGKGSGKAKGKPCAGCVGKADNKNPRGQQPGGEDANAGYECDDNEGVGQSNPAHTGCTDDDSATDERSACEDGREDDESGDDAHDGDDTQVAGDADSRDDELDDDAADDTDDCETPVGECDEDADDDECLMPTPAPGVGGADGGATTLPQPEVAGVEALAPRAAPQAAEAAPSQVAGAALLPATGSPAALALLAGAGTILLGFGWVALRRRAA